MTLVRQKVTLSRSTSTCNGNAKRENLTKDVKKRINTTIVYRIQLWNVDTKAIIATDVAPFTRVISYFSSGIREKSNFEINLVVEKVPIARFYTLLIHRAFLLDTTCTIFHYITLNN